MNQDFIELIFFIQKVMAKLNAIERRLGIPELKGDAP